MQIFDIIDSTQLEAKRQIDVKKLIIEDEILTNHQTAGVSTKKQFPWISQKGDLNVSMILNINVLLKTGNIHINHLPFTASLAVLDEILKVKNTSSKHFSPVLKWPNDVLIENNGKYKKICGILCDNYKDHFIIGIGCNLVSHPSITQHFSATNLLDESGVQVNNIDFAENVINSVHKNIKQVQIYGFEGIKNKWKKHAYMLGSTLCLRDGGEVYFEDITDNGYILARAKNEKKIVIIESDEIISSGRF